MSQTDADRVLIADDNALFSSALRAILEPEPGVGVLTGSADDGDVERARAAGAAGYLTKDRIAAELVEAVRSAARK